MPTIAKNPIIISGTKILDNFERIFYVSDDDASFYTISQDVGYDILWIADIADKELAMSVVKSYCYIHGNDIDDRTFN